MIIMNKLVNTLETRDMSWNGTFKISDENQLRRFLFLGSENGTLNASAKELTQTNLVALDRLLFKKDFSTILDIIDEYKVKIFKKDYILLVLAICCSLIKFEGTNEKDFKKNCFETVLEICKTPTNLFMFIEFYQKVYQSKHNAKGWNTSMKNCVSSWYNSKTPENLIYHVTKYKNRNGWSHKDVLRLSHTTTNDEQLNRVFRYIIKDLEENVQYPECFNYVKAIKHLSDESCTLDDVITSIRKFNLVREQIPTKWLNEKNVWDSMLPTMPNTALLRNLNKITSVGSLETVHKDDITGLDIVLCKISKIKDVHPLQLLISLKQYSSGQGDKGSLTWKPHPRICSALNSAFYELFDGIKATGKRMLLALDVSGSMSWTNVCGIDCLTAAEVACAMSMIFQKVEGSETMIMGFSNRFIPLDINCTQTLETNLKVTNKMTFGSTDISLPFKWAEDNNLAYDAVIVFTDSDTNSNKVPPVQALRYYRQAMKTDTKLVVCALAANNISIADPDDPTMLDICGFDSSTHNAINEFLTLL